MSPTLVAAINRLALYLRPRLWNSGGGQFDFTNPDNSALLIPAGVL